MSGEIAQTKRLKTLEQFKKGQIQVLVATDVAGRGIHVNGVTHVFNYNLPENAEDYVHRIGRTGRAGKTGVSVSFAGEEDAFALPEIEKYISQKLKTAVPEEDLMATMDNPPITRKRGARRPQGNRGSGGRGPRAPRLRVMDELSMVAIRSSSGTAVFSFWLMYFSISGRAKASSSPAKLTETPVLPARPVRPIRCT